MRSMEVHLMNAQQKNVKKEENAMSTYEYAKMHAKVNNLQSQVVALTNQLRQAKQISRNAQLVDHVNSQRVQYHMHAFYFIFIFKFIEK